MEYDHRIQFKLPNSLGNGVVVQLFQIPSLYSQSDGSLEDKLPNKSGNGVDVVTTPLNSSLDSQSEGAH